MPRRPTTCEQGRAGAGPATVDEGCGVRDLPYGVQTTFAPCCTQPPADRAQQTCRYLVQTSAPHLTVVAPEFTSRDQPGAMRPGLLEEMGSCIQD